MMFGTPSAERIDLNEETVWAGSPNNNVKPDAFPILQQTRALIFEKKYIEAQRLADSLLKPYGNSGMPYQPVGTLFVRFPGHDRFRNYYRDLDLGRAVTSVAYEVCGVRYQRTAFASFTQGVIILHLTASKPGRISCSLSMKSPQQYFGRRAKTLVPSLAGVLSTQSAWSLNAAGFHARGNKCSRERPLFTIWLIETGTART